MSRPEQLRVPLEREVQPPVSGDLKSPVKPENPLVTRGGYHPLSLEEEDQFKKLYNLKVSLLLATYNEYQFEFFWEGHL